MEVRTCRADVRLPSCLDGHIMARCLRVALTGTCQKASTVVSRADFQNGGTCGFSDDEAITASCTCPAPGLGDSCGIGACRDAANNDGEQGAVLWRQMSRLC